MLCVLLYRLWRVRLSLIIACSCHDLSDIVCDSSLWNCMSYFYLDLFSLPSFVKWRWGCYQTSPLGVVLYAVIGSWNEIFFYMSSCTVYIVHPLSQLSPLLSSLYLCWQPFTSLPWNMFEVLSCCGPGASHCHTVSFNLSRLVILNTQQSP